MKKFPNPNNNEWINKYNDLVEKIVTHQIIYETKSVDPALKWGDKYRAGIRNNKLTLHHIIPKSLAPELANDKDNFVYLPFGPHMDLHYYLWKADPQYGMQLWFGCVYGRKHKLWDLPGGEDEYNQLKKDVSLYIRNKRNTNNV